jgi:O-antigen ligase
LPRANVAPGVASSVWSAWAGSAALRVSRAFTLLAAALLFLSAAGTVGRGFTITPYYASLAIAVLVGAPFVMRGWAGLPRFCQLAALTLASIYALDCLVGSHMALAGGSVRSSHRYLLYTGDLLLGLGVTGLVVGTFTELRDRRRLVVCLALGGLAAALYALYQWPAQRFGWPLADVNNTVNSDGYTLGHRFQGAGLFGWERVRGTFREPLLLASYLSVTLLMVVGLVRGAHPRARIFWMVTITVIVLAMILTVSTLAWGTLLLVSLLTLLIWAIGSGRVGRAGLLGSAVTLALFAGVILFADPSSLSDIVSRSRGQLQTTAGNRVKAWDAAITLWEQRPLLGYGPGQASVRLAYRPSVAPGKQAPIVLGSAQGLWDSALVDIGIVGLLGWILLLGSLLATIIVHVTRRSSPLALGVLAAALCAVLLGQLTGDRLDSRVWLLLGLAAAAVFGGERRSTSNYAGYEPNERSDQDPSRGGGGHIGYRAGAGEADIAVADSTGRSFVG